MNTPADSSPPLSPDDPLVSEWLDGRLPAAEAAAVERAVSGSPTLARLVTDLRVLKQAARATAATSPPSGFVDRVMAAVVADNSVRRGDVASGTSDRLVDAEWRAIEAERIAEERAEAEADLDADSGPRPPVTRWAWPWLAVGTALAAGLLVTVVLNFPPRGPDEVEVAFVTTPRTKPVPQDKGLRKAAEREAADALKPLDGEAETAVAAPAGRARPTVMAEGGGLGAGEQAKAASAPPPAPAAAFAATESRRAVAKDAEKVAEPIEVVVRGPNGRANLLERLAALGLTPVVPRLASGASIEVIELVGPEEAVAAFLVAPLGEQLLAEGLSMPGEPAVAAPALATDAGEPPARKLEKRAASTPPRRILIRVIERPAAAGEPSDP